MYIRRLSGDYRVTVVLIGKVNLLNSVVICLFFELHLYNYVSCTNIRPKRFKDHF